MYVFLGKENLLNAKKKSVCENLRAEYLFLKEDQQLGNCCVPFVVIKLKNYSPSLQQPTTGPYSELAPHNFCPQNLYSKDVRF
jgi:hypothetical protein